MASKKIITFLSIIFIYSISLPAINFEGRIILSKQTPYDTTIYEYSVKKNLVRLDIKKSLAQVMQSLIIDLEKENIIALSPNHKLYTILKKNNQPIPDEKEDFEIIKTPNFKLINRYKCFLWHVRNKHLNSDIAFWVTELQFDFLPKVIKLLSRTDDYAHIINYYMQVNQDNTFFPILIIDRTLLKEEKSKMQVINIVNETVNDKEFEIPKDYQLLRY